MNIYTQHPATDHPERNLLVSITVEDKGYTGFWNDGWFIEVKDEWQEVEDDEVGYWFYSQTEKEFA